MSKQRDKGTKWETSIVDYLHTKGLPHAERRALHGTHDLGDISGIPGIVIEAKNQARHSWAEWLDEAVEETRNASADVGVVWAHRRVHPAHVRPSGERVEGRRDAVHAVLDLA